MFFVFYDFEPSNALSYFIKMFSVEMPVLGHPFKPISTSKKNGCDLSCQSTSFPLHLAAMQVWTSRASQTNRTPAVATPLASAFFQQASLVWIMIVIR
jgi:hypothetical protein